MMEHIFSKDLEVDGTASLNTIYSRFNDNVLINDNLIITGNITLGGTSFNQKVDDAITSSTLFNSKLDVGTTSAGGDIGKKYIYSYHKSYYRVYISRGKQDLVKRSRSSMSVPLCRNRFDIHG